MLLLFTESNYRKKADCLLKRSVSLLKTFVGRPLDLTGGSSGKALMTSKSTLNYTETQVRFMERSMGHGTIEFHKRLNSFEKRYVDLEQRIGRLEQEKDRTSQLS